MEAQPYLHMAKGTSLPKYIYVNPTLNTDATYGAGSSVANTVDFKQI
jgi:hypothetical protein